MNIRQLQVSYIPEQDRLLTRINTQDGAEIRLWLTRRLVLRLWPGLIRAGETLALESLSSQHALAEVAPEARGMMADMAREAALGEADFSTPFAAEPASLPLGQEPLLVNRVDLAPQGGGIMRVAFRQSETRGIEVRMAAPLLHAFCQLVQKEANKAEWNFKLEWTPATQTANRPSIN